MKAVEVARPGVLAIAERPMPPDPGSDEVLIKVKAVGICGSDMHVYRGRSAFATYPRVIGHEISGEVASVGKGALGLSAGDKVVVDPVISCGSCYACRLGRPNVCRDVKCLGVHVDGGAQEYIVAKRDKVYKVSQSLSFEVASTVEPYSIAAQALSRGRAVGDDMALVCGAGPIGLVILQGLKAIGAKVAIADVVDSRLERAASCGADAVINSGTRDLEGFATDFTGGEGFPLIFEATGNIQVLELLVSKLVSQAGRVVVLGYPSEKAQISPLDIMRRELDILGSRLNNNQFPTAIKWVERGDVDPSKIISHTFPFQDAQKAISFIEENPHEVCKAILKF